MKTPSLFFLSILLLHKVKGIISVAGYETLDRFEGLISETPAEQQPNRFGNPAYKVWAKKMIAESQALVEAILPADLTGATVELLPYLHDAFGNATRLDYGSG